jgi:hypothetical protein
MLQKEEEMLSRWKIPSDVTQKFSRKLQQIISQASLFYVLLSFSFFMSLGIERGKEIIA